MSIESEAQFEALKKQHPPYFGVVRNIIPASRLGADGNEPVAIIEHVVGGRNTQDWLPVDPQRFPEISSQVFIDPQITHVGKGFSVTYDIVF